MSITSPPGTGCTAQPCLLSPCKSVKTTSDLPSGVTLGGHFENYFAFEVQTDPLHCLLLGKPRASGLVVTATHLILKKRNTIWKIEQSKPGRQAGGCFCRPWQRPDPSSGCTGSPRSASTQTGLRLLIGSSSTEIILGWV